IGNTSSIQRSVSKPDHGIAAQGDEVRQPTAHHIEHAPPYFLARRRLDFERSSSIQNMVCIDFGDRRNVGIIGSANLNLRVHISAFRVPYAMRLICSISPRMSASLLTSAEN